MMIDIVAASSLTPSMWLRHANGVRLISAPTAVEIVRMIVKDEYGQADLERNEPLSVRDDGEAWVVLGSGPKPSNPPDPQWAGPLEVRISKFDGQILDYFYTILYS